MRERRRLPRPAKLSVEGESDEFVRPMRRSWTCLARRLRAPPLTALRFLTPPSRRRQRCTPGAAMADVSERTLQLSVLVAFASGVLLGWQANRLRRRYLDWRKKRLQDKLAATQKKLDLAWDSRIVDPRRPPRGHLEAASLPRWGLRRPKPGSPQALRPPCQALPGIGEQYL